MNAFNKLVSKHSSLSDIFMQQSETNKLPPEQKRKFKPTIVPTLNPNATVVSTLNPNATVLVPKIDPMFVSVPDLTSTSDPDIYREGFVPLCTLGPGGHRVLSAYDATPVEDRKGTTDNIIIRKRKNKIAALKNRVGIYHDETNNLYLDLEHGLARRTNNSDDPNYIEFFGTEDELELSLHYIFFPGNGKQAMMDLIKALKAQHWNFEDITLTPADGLDPEQTAKGADLSRLLRFYIGIGFEIQGDGTLIGNVGDILDKIDYLISGHVFTPGEQAIIEAKVAGARDLIEKLKFKKTRYNKSDEDDEDDESDEDDEGNKGGSKKKTKKTKRRKKTKKTKTKTKRRQKKTKRRKTKTKRKQSGNKRRQTKKRGKR